MLWKKNENILKSMIGELYRLEEHFLREVVLLLIAKVEAGFTGRVWPAGSKIDFFELVLLGLDNKKKFLIGFIHEILLL